MLKRIGVLAFVLAAGTFLKPTVASAQERFQRDSGRFVEVHRDAPRFERNYGREHVVVVERRNDWHRDYNRHDDRFAVQYRNYGFAGPRDCR
jgi:hypothetical protein